MQIAKILDQDIHYTKKDGGKEDIDDTGSDSRNIWYYTDEKE